MKEREEVQEEVKMTLSEEDKELLMKGIRPEWMPKEQFKFIRKASDHVMKRYLKGKMIYVSKVISEEMVEGKLKTVVRTAKPYVKMTEKS